MADILERVQKARHQALYSYLKEHTTHKLAVFIAKAENELIGALEEVFPGVTEDLRDPKYRQDAYRSAVSEIFSIKRVQNPNSSIADVIYNSFREHLYRNSDEHVIREFERLLDHLRKGQDTIAQVDDNPKPTLSEMANAETIRQHLAGMYESAVERAEQMTQKLAYELEHGHRRQPEVLILQGGGAKGMAYSGVVEVLEDSGLLKGIKRVGGTSAGALMGLPIALGYSAEEIHGIVRHSRFAQFYAESTMKFKAMTKLVDATSSKPLESRQWHEANMLTKFANNYLLPELALWTDTPTRGWTTLTDGRTQELLKSLEAGSYPHCEIDLAEIYERAREKFAQYLDEKGLPADSLTFQALLGRSEAFQAVLTCIRVKRPYGIHNSDSIEDFIGDIIQERLQKVSPEHLNQLEPPLRTVNEMREITFTQLKALSEMDPSYGFKEFGVAVTDSYFPISCENIKRKLKRDKMLSGERAPDPGTGDYDHGGDFKPVFVRASSDIHEYVDMPIKKAVRASMNLPFVFQAMKWHNSRLVDGGITTNFPHKIHADAYKTQQEVRDNTIGFMLSALEDNLENEALQELARNGTAPMSIDVQFEPERFSKKLSRIKDGLLSPFETIKGATGSAIGSIASKAIKNLMRANTMPSLETMNNIGLINSGQVGTGDFNASIRERDKLHAAGVQAAHSLLRWDADKHLRFAMGRLISLATIENKLLEERGHTPNLKLPVQALTDTDVLAQSLTDGRYDDWNLGSVLLGRMLPINKKASELDKSMKMEC